MSNSSSAATMRTLRFHAYGDPAEVLRIERSPVPPPPTRRIRVAVRACGLNPADWALCRGLFPGQLPRGVGLDVAGIVDAIGEDVMDIAVGDRVVGAADYAGSTSAGAADFAILNRWTRLPEELDFVEAAALPMAIETAYLHLDLLRVAAGQTILIHGAGSTIGFAAVQMALRRGARVIATAGETYAERLRAMGATVTAYGKGMVERVQALAEKPIDLALDMAPAPAAGEHGDRLVQAANRLVRGEGVAVDDAAPSSALSDLVRIVDGDAQRVVTISAHDATKLGVRTTFDLVRACGAPTAPPHDALREFVGLAAEGQFSVPVACTFVLEDWRTALDISLSGKARGKLVLLP